MEREEGIKKMRGDKEKEVWATKTKKRGEENRGEEKEKEK